MTVKAKLFLIAFTLTLSAASLAETRYVTDQLKITLRSGESAGHKILRMLPSGTPLEVMSTNPATGYSHVRTSSGQNGYVLERQLLKSPVARDRVIALEKEIENLKSAPARLSQELAGLKTEHRQLENKQQELATEKRRVEQEFVALQRTSANAVRISNERNALRKQVAELTQENAELQQQNQELSNSSLQNWFMVGAGVLGGGIILGLILPNLRLRRKQSSWNSL